MENESIKKGGISVETNHIFPVIKKWLYSEKDIFLREIISNATDAVTKLRRLSSLGIYDGGDEEYCVKVTLDEDAKTITVSDNGIGMTEEEIEKYICSIALSGALDFVKKYEDESNQNNGIIGHFGLGFYSSFMVSDTVEVITRSYTSDTAVRWSCNGSGDYEISPAERATHGTDVIMHISDDEEEYLDRYKINGILEKYCSFMSVDIYFEDVDEDLDDDDEGDEIDTEKETTESLPTPINDKAPLWQKNPSECTDEEYLAFYKKVFNDYREPLFWIHLNTDYPFKFNGILYFPRRSNEYESYEGQVKLFYNQVFVADDIKDVIPEYLLMLKGVLDCPDLPLNVSRSYLQDSTYVKKISDHIVKKVADKLCSLCKNDRQKFESIWKDIKIFVEYASMREKKFFDKVRAAILMELTDGTYMTIDEYLEGCDETHKGVIFYATDKEQQAQYISMFESQNTRVVLFPYQIDVQFISMCEYINSDLKFKRIDSDIADMLKSDGEITENEALVTLFRAASGNEKLDVKFQPLKDESIPAVITLSEESRRMEEMMKMYSDMGMGNMSSLPTDTSIVLNTKSELIKKLDETNVSDPDKALLIATEIYRLSVLSQRKLSADELRAFLSDSFRLLGML